MFKGMQAQVNRNLKNLKDACLENTWLQESHKTYQKITDELIEMDTNMPIRKRRSDSELDKDFECPYLGCPKVYSS